MYVRPKLTFVSFFCFFFVHLSLSNFPVNFKSFRSIHCEVSHITELHPKKTTQEPAVAPPGWWVPLLTGKFLFFSPNLVWLAIALFDYFVFPYDFQAAKSFDSLDWVCFRSDICHFLPLLSV